MISPCNSSFELCSLNVDTLWVLARGSAIQIGSLFGVLSILRRCQHCDDLHRVHFFFLNCPEDTLLKNYMEPEQEGNNYIVSLPSGDVGKFFLEKTNSKINDAMILKKVASVYEGHCDGYMTMFFDSLYRRITCTSAWKVMKRSYHRDKTEEQRLLTLYLLLEKGIYEVGLRERIVRLAKLW